MFNFYSLPNPGLLRLSGEHRLSFLQRQTSNNLQALTAEMAVATVLTTPNARILDVLCVFLEGDGLLATCLSPLNTSRFLGSRIFFMDRVNVADASADFAQVELFGPQVAVGLQALGFPPLPAGKTASQDNVRLLALEGIGGTAYRLIVKSAAAPEIAGALTEAGGVAVNADSYHVLRVEAGLPAAGSELSDAYTPLEVNLQGAVSTTKGCYTGQEVLTRQLSQDKVTRHLVGLKLQVAASPGSAVLLQGRPVGEITSAAESPRFGPIALAVLRRPAHEPGTTVSVEERPATVVALPF